MCNHISNQELKSRIYKELLKIKNKKQFTFKNDQRFEQKLPKTTYKQQMQKRCSKPLVIMEMQIKITARYYYTSMRMAKIKLSDHSKC